jgi:hypothetical protein
MLSIASDIMKHSDELVFWRESTSSQCQFNRFKNYQIYVEEGLNIEFRDITTNQPQNLPVTCFQGFNELMGLAKPKQLNVVYLAPYVDKNNKKIQNAKYIEFIKFLRLYPGWQSFFIDEYEDLAPLRCKGEQWHMNETLSNEYKNIRKGLVSIFGNTQHPADIDWRVRLKIMCHIYLNGAKVDFISPIDQGAVNALPMGTMFCDYGHALYGKGSFKPFPPKKPIMVSYII